VKFEQALKQFAEKTDKSFTDVLRASLLIMGKNIVYSSPVDTGRFRGNWQHGTLTPPSGYNSTFDPSGGGAISKLNSAVASIHAGSVEFFVNNLPYAIPLEYGHSKQAPEGMVRIEVARFQAAIKKAVGEIKK
jgi:hypothetical protein